MFKIIIVQTLDDELFSRRRIETISAQVVSCCIYKIQKFRIQSMMLLQIGVTIQLLSTSNMVRQELSGVRIPRLPVMKVMQKCRVELRQ